MNFYQRKYLIDSIDGNVQAWLHHSNNILKHDYCKICDCSDEHLCIICGTDISKITCLNNGGLCYDCLEDEI